MSIDYDAIFEREEFKNLKVQIAVCQQGLTDHNGRIKALEDFTNEKSLLPMIKDALEPRFKKLEERFDEMSAALDLKLGREELTAELDQKVDIEAITALRDAIEQLNQFVSSFTGRFADQAQNEREHKLLQK